MCVCLTLQLDLPGHGIENPWRCPRWQVVVHIYLPRREHQKLHSLLSRGDQVGPLAGNFDGVNWQLNIVIYWKPSDWRRLAILFPSNVMNSILLSSENLLRDVASTTQQQSDLIDVPQDPNHCDKTRDFQKNRNTKPEHSITQRVL